MLHFSTFAVALTVFAAITSGNCLGYCDNEEVCTDIFKEVEKAVLEDDTNLSRMRRAFFHSPTATPVLLKVVYNVSYAENITTTIAVDSNQLTKCHGLDGDSTIQLKQDNFTYGWTSSGVYTVFHPIVLSMMQWHTPFVILKIIQVTLGQSGPEADTFLWDGSYELPTLHLDVHLSSLPCLPSKETFESVLMDLNTLIKVYAGQQRTLSFVPENTALGFTLPRSSVTTDVQPSGSDVKIAITYAATLCGLYSVSVCLFPLWFCCPDTPGRREHVRKLKRAFRENKELLGGLLSTSVIAIAFEFCVRLYVCIRWTIHKENGTGNFLAVWLPQLILFLFATGMNIIGHACVHKHQWLDRMKDIVYVLLNIDNEGANNQEGEGDENGGINNQEGEVDENGGINNQEGEVDENGGINNQEGEVDENGGINDQELGEVDEKGGVNNQEGEVDENGDINDQEGEVDETDNEISRKIRTHTILAMNLTAFGLIYCFFPAIILTLVYPSRMIVIFTFVLAYFFATTVVFAVIVKLRGGFLREEGNRRKRTIVFLAVYLASFLLIALIYVLFLVFLYAVIVGRGSAVSTGPLTIISVLPSIFISFIAWVIKRVVLNGARQAQGQS